MTAVDPITGLGHLRNLIELKIDAPYLALLKLNVVDAGDGWAKVEANPHEAFNNHQQRIHGGFTASLIDTALGCAVMTKLPAKIGYGTIELKVNFVRKISPETVKFTAHATVLHAGRTMLTAEAKVVDDAGLLYAHGSGTFLVYPI